MQSLTPMDTDGARILVEEADVATSSRMSGIENMKEIPTTSKSFKAQRISRARGRK